MKLILSGMAIAAVMALFIPAWAQVSGGTSTSNETSAMAAKHGHPHAVPHMTHGKAAMHARGAQTGGNNVANGLNQQEMSRLQAGSSMAPSASPMMGGPGPAASTMGGAGSMSRSPGPKTSGSGYAPSQPGAGTASPNSSPAAPGATTGAPR